METIKKTAPAKKKTPVNTPKKTKVFTPTGARPMLTQREMVFVREYIIDMNGERAYKVAYGKDSMKSSVARAAASRLLTRVNVKAAIANSLSGAMTRRYTSAGFVINNLGRLAEASIGNFVTIKKGVVNVDFSGVTKEDLYQLSELTIEEYVEPGQDEGGESRTVKRIKFKIVDRLAAINLLARLGDLYERSKREVSEHVARILRSLRDNDMTAREAAYELHLIGQPLPDALKIELLKLELAPPDTGGGITDEELERRYNEAKASVADQRKYFLPARQTEVAQMKKDMAGSWSFKPSADDENE